MFKNAWKCLIWAQIIFFMTPPQHCLALNMMGRLGVGMSGQLANQLPALSFKVQNSREAAYSGLMAVDANSNNTNYGFGLKLYRILFDEPHLNFYAAFMGALLKKNDQSGYQLDGTLGSEFHIPGIESLGLSFDFGMSWNKVNNVRHIETVGYNFISAALHFYL